jgi:hypothetical protein
VEFVVVEDRLGPSAVNVKSLGVVSILHEEDKPALAEKQDGSAAAFRPAWMSASAAPSSQPVPSASTVPDEPLSHEDDGERSLSKHKMLEWIKTIDERDPEILLLHMNVLEQVLNSDEMPFTVIQPLVLILTRDEVLDSERTDKVYNAVLESKFMRNPRNLRSYILKLSSMKNPTSEDIHSFERVLVLLQELMDRCRTYRDLPLDALDPSRCSAFPSSIASGIDKLTKMASDIPFVLNLLFDYYYLINFDFILNIRTQSTQSMINTNWAPQEEDFRDMPIFPTTEEILGVKSGELNPRLRASIFVSPPPPPPTLLLSHLFFVRY